MKKYINILPLFATLIIQAQVGINTKNPTATLHVNGTTLFTKDFNVGGDASRRGNSGLKGQLLVSKGINQAPQWENPNVLDIPQVANISSRTLTTRLSYGGYRNVVFNVSDVTYSNYIIRESNNTNFKVIESGLYLINAYANAVEFPNTGQSGTGTGGTFGLLLKKTSNNDTSNIAIITAGYNVGNDMRLNISSVAQLSANDIINLQSSYTRDFNLTKANITFTLIKKS